MRYVLILLLVCIASGCKSPGNRSVDEAGGAYFPEPDSLGGWRTLTDPADIRKIAGMDPSEMDTAFDFIRGTTNNGGLLILRHGYLVYEKYFGLGQRDATPNLGSCGKSFTSIAFGIMMNEYPAKFPDGFDQKILHPAISA